MSRGARRGSSPRGGRRRRGRAWRARWRVRGGGSRCARRSGWSRGGARSSHSSWWFSGRRGPARDDSRPGVDRRKGTCLGFRRSFEIPSPGGSFHSSPVNRTNALNPGCHRGFSRLRSRFSAVVYIGAPPLVPVSARFGPAAWLVRRTGRALGRTAGAGVVRTGPA